ncbi:hypothetical protein CORC01_13453 [Colletotrichum orchidophilum]|uniref:Uncharacterized protein n=1 Tax=Colletotrichum orchidophilum TaxID=1209926 RepID=A0A1G4AQ95_9PEZI|nr:uncharacterized protein CORC01_13453 [Colletotrichum orchidophilum]OHE91253.1 hypothetical protein CORC01_13453 [Colletotrichum orchidophilum]
MDESQQHEAQIAAKIGNSNPHVTRSTAQDHIQHRVDQISEHDAIPNSQAENLMQNRAYDIRQNLKIPANKRQFPGICIQSHSIPGVAPVADMGPYGGGGGRAAAPMSSPAARARGGQFLTPSRPSVTSSPSQFCSLVSNPFSQYTTPFSQNIPSSSLQHPFLPVAPNGRPMQNPMVAALSSGQQRRFRARLQMDKNRRARVVKVTSPQKPPNSSSPPIPSSLRSVKLPPLPIEISSDSSTSDEPIPTTHVLPGSQLRQDPTKAGVMSNISFSSPPPPMFTNGPFTSSSFSSQSPPVLPNDFFSTSCPSSHSHHFINPQGGHYVSPAEEIAMRVANARSLAHNGYRGTFEIGRLTCLINPYTGEPDPIAETRPDARGNMVTYDLHTKKDVLSANPSMPPKVAELPDKHFNCNGKDAWMGARLGEGTESVMLHEEVAPTATNLGPTPYWIKEANETLGIPNDNDGDDEGLFENCDLDFDD